ncbi:MAG TPA: FAD-dependent oxidoreductase [Ktedonobacteraceae bacterium]|nr:FAD-dependent oxidoreductase [Ktedonobacteraceae bacterium]
MFSIAIIGAGCSGLAAAYPLRQAGYNVNLYEQNADVGGRAATARDAGFIYDYGAQYIKQGSPASVSLITERFATPDLIDIAKPIWTFDGSGTIREGDPAQNAEPRWNYRYGLDTLPRRMATALSIHTNCTVTRLQRHTGGWHLFDQRGEGLGSFDTVLITLPAPQASALLRQSECDDALKQQLYSYLEQAHYNPLISVMLGYRPRPEARPYYALVNTDKAHAISWLAWEHEKAPERTPADTGLLIAQMAPQYSHDYMQESDETIVRDVAVRVTALLKEPFMTPFFSDVRRWDVALPGRLADGVALNALAIPEGLAFCGDAFSGGRVHLALEQGLTIAQQIIEHHGETATDEAS